MIDDRTQHTHEEAAPDTSSAVLRDDGLVQAGVYAVAALVRTFESEQDKARLLQRLQAARKRLAALDHHGELAGELATLERMEREALRLAALHLERREQLAAGAVSLAASTDWKRTRTALDAMAHEWRTLGWSDDARTAPLRLQFTQAVASFTRRQEQWFDEQRMRGASAADYCDYLCTRVEQLADETDDTMRPAAGERLQQLKHLWKQTAPSGTGATGERFATAVRSFEDRRDAWYAGNAHRKEELLDRLAVLATTPAGPAWSAATREAADIARHDWSAAGPVAQPLNEPMNRRLRETLASFQECREEAEHSALLQKKKLLTRICALAQHPPGNWKATRAVLLELQDAWTDLGPASDTDEADLLRAYRAACQSVVDRLGTLRGNSSERRREVTLTIAEMTQKAGVSVSWRDARDKVLLLQKQYVGAGPVDHATGEILWQEYRAACDLFFERYRAWTTGNVEGKEALITEAEDLLTERDAFAATERAKDLQQRWKTSGPVPQEQNEALWSRFSDLMDRIFDRARQE